MLPADLGIVISQDRDDDADCANAWTSEDVIPERAILSRGDALDVIGLTELGGTPVWPRGGTFKLVQDLVKAGS